MKNLKIMKPFFALIISILFSLSYFEPISVLAANYTIYVDSTTADDTAVLANNATYRTLAGAISKVQSGDVVIIIIVNPAAVSSSLSIPNGKDITIQAQGTGEIVRAVGYTSMLFDVRPGGKLTLDGITVDGGAIWNSGVNVGVVASASMIYTSGTMVITGGAIIRNNDAGTATSGGLISVRAGANLTIDNADIYGGSASSGGAILVADANSTLNLINATIHDNQAVSTAGAIAIMFGGEVTMQTNVSIYNNVVHRNLSTNQGHGGAFYINGGVLNIYGGDIYNNEALGSGASGGYGGAISMNGGTINMTAGTIRDNKSSYWGGAIYFGAGSIDSILNMTGGSISNNNAAVSGGAIFAYNISNPRNVYMYILGGSITGNTTTADAIGTQSGAIFNRDAMLYLNMEVEIDGPIHLHLLSSSTVGDSVITLVNVPATPLYNYLISTDTTFSVDTGRVVVVPGTITHSSGTYSVTDAEPYVSYFKHVTRNVVEGSIDTFSTTDTTYLVLSNYIVSFNLNTPTGIPTPSSIPSLLGGSGDIIMLIPGFPTATPALSGYNFIGWTLDQAGTIPVTNSTTIGGTNITLYGQWSLIPVVTPTVPISPKTGNSSSIEQWLVLLAIVGMGSGIIATRKCKQEQ